MKILCSLGKEVGESGKRALMPSPWPGYKHTQFQITAVGVQLREAETQVCSGLKHPRRLRFRYATFLGFLWKFQSWCRYNIAGPYNIDAFFVSKCKSSSHAQSIHLKVTLLLCCDSLLMLLAIPFTASRTVPWQCMFHLVCVVWLEVSDEWKEKTCQLVAKVLKFKKKSQEWGKWGKRNKKKQH